MHIKTITRLILAGLLGLAALTAAAQNGPDEEFLYGRQLTTQQEREQYRQRLQEAASDQERQRIQTEHRRMIQDRAKARGMNEEGIYGRQLMSPEERRAHHDRLRNAQTVEERQQIRTEHRRMIDARMMQRKRQRVHEPGTGGGTGAGTRHSGSDAGSQGNSARQGSGKGGGRGADNDNLRGKGRKR